MENLIKFKAIVSLLLIVLFVVVFVSGVGLDLAPPGRMARQTGWNFLGFDKHSLKEIHSLAGYLASGLVTVHLLLNYKTFVSGIKTLFGRK